MVLTSVHNTVIEGFWRWLKTKMGLNSLSSVVGVPGFAFERRDGFTIRSDWVPDTEHQEARFAYPHGPTHALHGNFLSIVLIRWVYYLTIVVIVAGEH